MSQLILNYEVKRASPTCNSTGSMEVLGARNKLCQSGPLKLKCEEGGLELQQGYLAQLGWTGLTFNRIECRKSLYKLLIMQEPHRKGKMEHSNNIIVYYTGDCRPGKQNPKSAKHSYQAKWLIIILWALHT